MPNDTALSRALDPVLARAVGDSTIPGVVAALTTPDGIIYEAGFGRRGLDAATPMTPDTVFRIASMTKAVVGVAVMQLVERGVLDLDAPAGALVPYLGEVQVLEGFGENGEALLRAPRTPVTLRHLLTHTAGFAYDRWCVAQHRWSAATGFAGTGRDGFRTPLMFDPGTGWQYGVGYDWAGMVIEAATGKRLGDVVTENLLAPLGMDDTAWVVTGARRGRMARNHFRGPDRTFTVDPGEPPEVAEHENGGGGLHATAADYLKFIRMILNRGAAPGGRRLIGEAAFAELVRADAAPANTVTPLVTTDPSRSNAGGFFPGLPQRHTLAFVTNEQAAPTGRSAGSLHWSGFYNTYYWIDPTRRLGGVFLTQIVPFLDVEAVRVFGEFETAVYGVVD
jgi:methyl acetate hydrolase